MPESEPAFIQWMRANHPDILNQPCPYNTGAIFLAKQAWTAARNYEQTLATFNTEEQT